MACCAFALFLIFQVAASFAWLNRLVPKRFRMVPREGSAAAMWQPAPAGVSAMAAVPDVMCRHAPSRRRRWVTNALWLELAVALGLFGGSAAALAAAPGDAITTLSILNDNLCRVLGITP